MNTKSLEKHIQLNLYAGTLNRTKKIAVTDKQTICTNTWSITSLLKQNIVGLFA